MSCNEGDAKSRSVRETVREGYARVAQSGGSCCPQSPCCGGGDAAEALARQLGYGEAELSALPQGANMGLSCGNPTAIASLKPGEVVLDLGSGGGFDVFIAARRVGPTGRAIGVDMTPEMISAARRNAEQFRATAGLDDVEFRLGEIEHLPVADASVDVVVSNCVINLSPDKPQVWREIARVLKPGGRVAVSDIALKQPLPEALKQSAEALIGCVAGAVLIEETRRMADEAGLTDIRLEADPAAVDLLAQSNDPIYQQATALLPEGKVPSDYVVSVNLTAIKPEGRQ